MEYVTLEPHWPSLLKFFKQAASEATSKKKRAEFTARANEIQRYLDANPDKAV